MSSFFHLSFGRTSRFLLGLAVLGAVLASAFSLLLPLRYSSSVSVFISQLNVVGLDPYTALKTAERIGTGMSELMYGTTFASNALTAAQSHGFVTTYFSGDDYARRMKWRDAISTKVAAGTGIMTVIAYHPSPDQARLLADAVAQELVLETPNFFGANVRVQVIDAPLNSRWFTRPNIPVNAGIGFALGFLLGAVWILIRWPLGRGAQDER